MINSFILGVMLSAAVLGTVNAAATYDFPNPNSGLSQTYTFTNLGATPPTVTAVN